MALKGEKSHFNSVCVDDATIYFSVDDAGGVTEFLKTNGIYEEALSEFYEYALEPGDIVFDIGANIGYFSVFFSRWVGPNGRVFAFEPDARNIEYLKKNLASNACANVEIVNKAVSEKIGPVAFYVDPTHWSIHSLVRDNVAHKPLETVVEAITLDSFHAALNIQRGLVIKLDTQGAEPFVVRGGDHVFRDHCKLVTLEYWPAGIRNFGEEPNELLHVLYDMGFSFASVPRKPEFKTYTFDALCARLRRKNFGRWGSTNLIGLKVPPKTRFNRDNVRQRLAMT